MWKEMPKATKSGGGKLESLPDRGDRGIPAAGAYPPKASVDRKANCGQIDCPGMKGDMGIPGKPKPKAGKPPLSE